MAKIAPFVDRATTAIWTGAHVNRVHLNVPDGSIFNGFLGSECVRWRMPIDLRPSDFSTPTSEQATCRLRLSQCLGRQLLRGPSWIGHDSRGHFEWSASERMVSFSARLQTAHSPVRPDRWLTASSSLTTSMTPQSLVPAPAAPAPAAIRLPAVGPPPGLPAPPQPAIP